MLMSGHSILDAHDPAHEWVPQCEPDLGELMEWGIKPLHKNAFDLIAIATYRLFTATFPNQVRFQISLPSLLKRDRHPSRGVFRVDAARRLSGRANAQSAQLSLAEPS